MKTSKISHNGITKLDKICNYELDFLLWRVTAKWGTYGIDGKSKLNFIHPCDISNKHLENIIIYLSGNSNIINEIDKLGFSYEILNDLYFSNFIKEYLMRKDTNLYIED
jgi:hypothetical protein